MSNSSSRKRQQRSKAGLQNKVNQREHPNQPQRQQPSQHNQKNFQNQHSIQQNQTQQQQQRQSLYSSKTSGEVTTTQTSAAEASSTQRLMSTNADCLNQDKSKARFQEDRLAIHTAIFSRQYEVVDELLKISSRTRDADSQGNTAFMTACRVGDIRLMSTLWDASSASMDVNHVNKEGETALHLCAKAGHEEGCKFLLSCGANANAKNTMGDTALHLAAQNDHVSVCQSLLNSLMPSGSDNGDLYRCISEKNLNEQTAVCLSIKNNHAEVTRILLESLSAQQQANYLTSSLQKVLSRTTTMGLNSPESREQLYNNVFLHGLLVSMSVLLIRMAERRKREKVQSGQVSQSNETKLVFFLTDSDVIQMLVRIACVDHVNLQILTIACFLLVYLMEGLSERETISTFDHDPLKRCIANNILLELNKTSQIGMKFIEQFLQCGGPDNLIIRLNNTEMMDPTQAAITMATATPVMFLARSSSGRAWLENNKGHLTFLKELLLQNRSNFALLISTCPLLTLSFLESTCQEFIKLVEHLEDRDREKNLAELLWEEERDRIRRERRKQKRNQTKQQVSKQLKKDVALLPVQLSEASSEEDAAMSCPDSASTNGRIDQNIWKHTETLDTEDGKLLYDKTNAMKECRFPATGIKDGSFTFPTDFSDVNDHHVEEMKTSQTDHKLETHFNDLTKKANGSLSNSIKTGGIEPTGTEALTSDKWTQQLIARNIAETTDIGAVSKLMRWADVAKLGCQTTSGSSNLTDRENSDSFFKFSCGKARGCDFGVSNNFRDSNIFAVDKTEDLDKITRQEASEQIMLDNEWFHVVNQCRDINSDEESSSSSSSFESRSSLVSDSFLNTKMRTFAADDIHIQTDLSEMSKPTQTQVTPKTRHSLYQCKKRKNKKACRGGEKGKALDPRSLCTIWDSSSVSSNQIISVPSADRECEHKAFRLPGVGCSLHRSRSEDVLVDWSWASDFKDCASSIKEKTNNTVKKSRASKMPWRELNPGVFRPETPATLPPLKIAENGINSKGGLCDDCTSAGVGGKRWTEIREEDIDKKSVVKTPCDKHLCHSKSAALNTFQPEDFNTLGMRADSTAFQNKDNVINIPSNLTSWSDLSKLVPASTLTQQSHLKSPIQDQDSNHTQPPLPPPGFQNHDLEISAQTIVDSNVKIDETNRINTGQKIASASIKGRVITTVLLDKVKNPPSFLQRNKVPPLSTLAWTCSEDPNPSWSKLLPSMTKSTNITSGSNQLSLRNVARESVESNLITTTSRSNLDTSIQSNLSDLGKNSDYDAMMQSRLGISLGTNSPTIVNEAPTFSTILMNRIQQRHVNRNQFESQNLPQGKTCTKGHQGMNLTPLLCNKESTSQLNKSNLTSLTASDVLCLPKSNNYHPQNNLQRHCGNATVNRLDSQHQYQRQRQEIRTNFAQSTQHLEPVGPYLNSDGEFSMGRQREKSNASINDRGNSLHPKQCETQQWLSPYQSSSPPVFFPEKIRDEESGSTENATTFPTFHDVQTSDFLSEMFSDPLFSDKIALNQIRQKILFNHTNQNCQSEVSPQQSAANEIDLDYYASLYRMKFRDVLGHLPGQCHASLRQNRESSSFAVGQKANAVSTHKDCQVWQSNTQTFEVGSPSGRSVEVQQQWQPSSRWRSTLQKILDLPWTTRRQYEDIVLPQSIPEFSIGVTENVVVFLGFLMDGTEVAVLMIDKSHERIIPRMVEAMCDSEIEKYFLAYCKSYSESKDFQFIAVNLFEYTLCEYLQMYIPACNQSAAIFTGLVWQLFQALNFIHQGFGIPHGRLAPCWVFINVEGKVRLAGFGINSSPDNEGKRENENVMSSQGYEFQPSSFVGSEDISNDRAKPSISADVKAAGMLAYFILSRGKYQFGASLLEAEINLLRDRVGPEAFDLICPMMASDPKNRPTIDQCLKHPVFWSADKKFRLILIVGSDVLTEMKTGVALTGSGAPTMMEILSMVDINVVSPNWIHEVDSTVLKEMRSFRVYKNNLAELTLFVYNCCLHFDKLSNVAKEILDDPCKYFQNLFPSLFMAIYRSLKASDRSDRTCYKPFF